MLETIKANWRTFLEVFAYAFTTNEPAPAPTPADIVARDAAIKLMADEMEIQVERVRRVDYHSENAELLLSVIHYDNGDIRLMERAVAMATRVER